jgi:hemerythrin
MLQWSEEFETGHPLIDTQHQMLVSYINRLEGLSRNTNPSRRDVEFILQFIEFMENYIVVHFQQEEQCMEQHRCPALQQNKDAHCKFLDFFRQFKHRFDTEGCRPEVLSTLCEACNAWIQQHILRIDLQLKPCLRQAAATSQPEPSL